MPRLDPTSAFTMLRHALIHVLNGDIVAAFFCERGLFFSSLPTSLDRGGWFYKPAREWEAEYQLRRRDIERSRKILLVQGILREKRMGNPFQLYYKFDGNRVDLLLREYEELQRKIRSKEQELAKLKHEKQWGALGAAEDTDEESSEREQIEQATDELSEYDDIDLADQDEQLETGEASSEDDASHRAGDTPTKHVPGVHAFTEEDQEKNTEENNRSTGLAGPLSGGGTGITLLSTSGVPFPVFDTRLLDLEQRFRGFDVAAALRELSARRRANPGERVAFDDVDEAMEHWLEMKASGKVRPTSESASSIPETELVR